MTKKLLVELNITLSEDAYIPTHIIEKVEGLGWGPEEAPTDSDYLLEFIAWLLEGYREVGIQLDSLSVGVPKTFSTSKIIYSNKGDSNE